MGVIILKYIATQQTCILYKIIIIIIKNKSGPKSAKIHGYLFLF